MCNITYEKAQCQRSTACGESNIGTTAREPSLLLCVQIKGLSQSFDSCVPHVSHLPIPTNPSYPCLIRKSNCTRWPHPSTSRVSFIHLFVPTLLAKHGIAPQITFLISTLSIIFIFLTPSCALSCYSGQKIATFLEEAGLEYDAHTIDIRKGEQFNPEFLKISVCFDKLVVKYCFYEIRMTHSSTPK